MYVKRDLFGIRVLRFANPVWQIVFTVILVLIVKCVSRLRMTGIHQVEHA